jgi:hypothetical protein
MFCRLIFGLSFVPLGPSTRSLRTEARVERQSFPRVKICHPKCPGWTIDVSEDVPLIGESIELNRGAVVDAGSVARDTVSDCLSALASAFNPDAEF